MCGLCHEFRMHEELFFTCALLVEHANVAELLEIDGSGFCLLQRTGGRHWPRL